MGWLKIFFDWAHDDVPLRDRDVIEIAPPEGDDDLPETGDARVINFKYIAKTGNIPIFSGTSFSGIFRALWLDQHIDFDRKDSFTDALETIKQETFRRIREDPECQELRDLLEEKHWNRSDREVWEESVSKIVSEEMDKISGLDRYRITSREVDGIQAKKRSRYLNELSEDIDNGTTNIEFDCEGMSVVEGLILQQTDEEFLPPVASEGDLKVKSNYFRVRGKAKSGAVEDDWTGHAFIISSATGNVIEAIMSGDNNRFEYNRSIDCYSSFEKFLNTGFFKSLSGDMYVGSEFGDGDIAALEAEYYGGSYGCPYINPSWASGYDSNGDVVPPEVQSLAELKIRMLEVKEDLEKYSFKFGEDYYFSATMARDNDVEDYPFSTTMWRDNNVGVYPFNAMMGRDKAVEDYPQASEEIDALVSSICKYSSAFDDQVEAMHINGSMVEVYKFAQNHPQDEEVEKVQSDLSVQVEPQDDYQTYGRQTSGASGSQM